MDVLARVQRVTAERLVVAEAEVVPGADFKETLGADSLDMVELCMAFEDEFNVEIPNEDLRDIQTVDQAVRYIEGKLASRAVARATYAKWSDDQQGVMFWCPACDGAHGVPIEGPRAWGFNHDLERPTLKPSLRIMGGPSMATTCHCTVTDGRIHFHDDSPHQLRGQTVDLPTWE